MTPESSFADLNDFIEAYEVAQSAGPAPLHEFLPPPDDPLYATVLRELVRVDLEYSWKRGQPAALEQYQQAFPALFDDARAVQEIAYEDYRLRVLAGEKPAAADYRRRYQVDIRDWTLRDEPAPAADKAWEILERLLQGFEECDQSREEIQHVLEAVREGVQADAVFSWDVKGAKDAVTIAASFPLPPRWCRKLGQFFVEQQTGAEDPVLLPFGPFLPGPEGRTVRSATLVRLGESRAAWMVALRWTGDRFHDGDVRFLKLARQMWLNHRQHTRTYEKLKDTLFSLIHCLTSMIDARDPYTCGHSERVARIAVRLGRQMGLPGNLLSDLYLAGLLHDIGKIGISDQVLLKPGKLTAEEFAHIQAHPLIGDRIVATVKQLAALRPGIRNHHERYDGHGYPDRLSGKNIPLLARILAVADSCDAMMSPRPYRPALPTSKIDDIMQEGAGSQWDPEIIAHFMTCRHELYSVCQRGIGLSVARAVETTLQSGGESFQMPSLAET